MGLNFLVGLALLNRRAAATAAHRDRGAFPGSSHWTPPGVVSPSAAVHSDDMGDTQCDS